MLLQCSIFFLIMTIIIIAKLMFCYISCFSHIFYEANKQLFVTAFVCAFCVAQQQKSLFSVFKLELSKPFH